MIVRSATTTLAAAARLVKRIPAAEGYRRLRTRLSRVVFERGMVSTAGYVDLRELDAEAPGRRPYLPSGWWVLRRGLRGRTVTRADVFLDLGCGAGRVVRQATRYPFGRIVGVEVSDRLLRMARENLSRDRRARSAAIELVWADAAEWPIPDDVTVVYLFDPFEASLLERVVQNLIASLDRVPRRMTVIYLNPRSGDVLRASGRFRLDRISRGIRPDLDDRRVHVYEAVLSG